MQRVMGRTCLHILRDSLCLQRTGAPVSSHRNPHWSVSRRSGDAKDSGLAVGISLIRSILVNEIAKVWKQPLPELKKCEQSRELRVRWCLSSDLLNPRHKGTAAQQGDIAELGDMPRLVPSRARSWRVRKINWQLRIFGQRITLFRYQKYLPAT